MQRGGVLLREYRKRVGLSQIALARRSNVNHATISRIEQNLDILPLRETVDVLISGMGLSPEDGDRLLQAFGYAPVLNWQARAELAEAEVRRLRAALHERTSG